MLKSPALPLPGLLGWTEGVLSLIIWCFCCGQGLGCPRRSSGFWSGLFYGGQKGFVGLRCLQPAVCLGVVGLQHPSLTTRSNTRQTSTHITRRHTSYLTHTRRCPIYMWRHINAGLLLDFSACYHCLLSLCITHLFIFRFMVIMNYCFHYVLFIEICVYIFIRQCCAVKFVAHEALMSSQSVLQTH